MTHTPLTAADLPGVVWRKSSYSDGEGGNCVEVADVADRRRQGVAIRDSKNRSGPALLVTEEQFTTFLSALRVSGLGPLP